MMPQGTSVELTIVIPAFNEATRLPPTLERLGDELDIDSTEIIVVDDGSTDATSDLARDQLREIPRSSIITQAANRGKGAAVRTGVAAATGSRLLFMDADLATDLSCVPLLVAALDDAEVAVGSRELPESEASNTWGRSLMRRAWNQLIRTTSNLDVRDTQCGFKAFRTDAAKLLFRLSTIDRYAFDVEILSLAQRLDMRIVEVPVRWRAVDGSKVRPVGDSLAMLRDLRRATRVEPRLRVTALVLDADDTAADLRATALVGTLDGATIALFPGWARQDVEALAEERGTSGGAAAILELEPARLLDRLRLS